MKLIRTLILSAALALPLSVLAIDPAAAAECVPSAAVEAIPATPGTPAVPAVTEAGWQRYSWTGGPVEGDAAPAFPGADWQPNVKGDPHQVGVAGAYYRSHGGSGKGDWFYLEATTTVVTPEVPAVPGTPEIPGTPAVVCPELPVVIPDPEPMPEVPELPELPEPSELPELPEAPVVDDVDTVVTEALPHTGLDDEQVIVGGIAVALIIAGGVAIYASREQ